MHECEPKTDDICREKNNILTKFQRIKCIICLHNDKKYKIINTVFVKEVTI